MAEIPKFTGSPVYNEPIGVVKAAESRVGEAMAEAGQALFDYSYKKSYAAEELKGSSFAEQAVLQSPFSRDKDGKLVAKADVTVPDSFSKVARISAQAKLDERYVERLTTDVQRNLGVMHAEHDNKKDFVGFANKAKTMIDETVKALQADPSMRKYAGAIQQAMSGEAAQHFQNLYSGRLDLEHKKAFMTATGLLENGLNDLRAYASIDAKEYESGDVVLDAEDLRDQIISKIDRLAEDYTDQASRDVLKTLRETAHTEFFAGRLDLAFKNLSKNIADNFNPANADVPISMVMQSAQLALNAGDMSVIKNPQHRALLEQAGFTQEFLSSPQFGAVKDKLQSTFRTYENDAKSQAESARNTNLSYFYKRSLEIGAIGKDGANHVFKMSQYNISTPTDLARNLPVLLTSPSFKNTDEYKVIMGSGPMPDAMKEMLQPRFAMALIAEKPSMAKVLKDLVRQSTMRADGLVNNRGLSAETIMFYEGLNEIANGTTPLRPEQILAKMEEFENNSAIREGVNDKITAFSPDYKNVNDFVAGAVGGSQRLASHFQHMAPALISVYGAETAFEIIKNSVPKVFGKSDLLYSPQGTKQYSLYTPERHYTGDGEVELITGAAQTKLSGAANRQDRALKIGSNAFLDPVPTGSRPVNGQATSLPSYYIVNKLGQRILGTDNRPLMVGPQAVLTVRASKAQQALELQKLDARNARQRHLDMTNELNQRKLQPLGSAASQLGQQKLRQGLNKKLEAERKRMRDLIGQQ